MVGHVALQSQARLAKMCLLLQVVVDGDGEQHRDDGADGDGHLDAQLDVGGQQDLGCRQRVALARA